MNPPTPVLQISGLTKHYGGVKALTDAHFRLMPGEHVAIVGDNGAGKSTFVRLITGVEQPNSGEIVLSGQAVSFDSPLDAREQGIETVYQTLALAEDLDEAVAPQAAPPTKQSRLSSATAMRDCFDPSGFAGRISQ